MKAYPKTSQKFTREQLIFIADVMIASAIDSIDSCDISSDKREIFCAMIEGVKEKLGFDLAILFAQITDDGIGCCDVMSITNVEKVIANYIDHEDNPVEVNTTKIATKFVNTLFKDYLKKS
jgi:hypothetical protein